MSSREREFALGFVRHGNASKAARDAGYERDSGWDLRHLPQYGHVQRFIESLQQDHLALIKRELPASVAVLVRQRDFDPGCLKDEQGNWRPWADLDPEDRACLTEFSEKTYEGGSSLRVKWANASLAAAKLVEWTLRHADNQPKESESEIKAQLKQRLAALAAELFPEEEGAPIIVPDKPEATQE